MRPGKLFDLRPDLVFLVFEKDVEGGHGAVAARDVLLHFDFFAIGEFFVAVDLLFEDAEVVAHHGLRLRQRPVTWPVGVMGLTVGHGGKFLRAG